jgi:outer membrane receptor protein involved in Fe transport
MAATDDLTLSFAGSYNDAELVEPFWRSDDDRIAGLPPTAPAGTEMPYVPEIQFTARGRYAFDFGNLPGYAQLGVSYTGDSWNDLEVAQRLKQDSYTLVNASIGVRGERWSLDLYGNNLTDERAQIDRLDPGYASSIDTTIAVNRPRSFGIRFGQKF